MYLSETVSFLIVFLFTIFISLSILANFLIIKGTSFFKSILIYSSIATYPIAGISTVIHFDNPNMLALLFPFAFLLPFAIANLPFEGM